MQSSRVYSNIEGFSNKTLFENFKNKFHFCKKSDKHNMKISLVQITNIWMYSKRRDLLEHDWCLKEGVQVYISLYWSKAAFASISSLRNRSDGRAPSSNGGS